ncbi:hypothetical protein J6590_030136 [Homalodisca vitripennis]|nr:hypothetical protein J6590_030136 [Homalodisca vitripennis]
MPQARTIPSGTQDNAAVVIVWDLSVYGLTDPRYIMAATGKQWTFCLCMAFVHRLY